MPLRICLLVAGLAVAATGAANADMVTTRGESVLRGSPDPASRVIGHIPAGSRLDVAGCAGGWCQVPFNGTVGFVAAPDLRTAARTGASPRATAENVHGSRSRVSRRSTPSNQGSRLSVHALTPAALPPAHP
jgi:uncharacterized protein YraI